MRTTSVWWKMKCIYHPFYIPLRIEKEEKRLSTSFLLATWREREKERKSVVFVFGTKHRSTFQGCYESHWRMLCRRAIQTGLFSRAARLIKTSASRWMKKTILMQDMRIQPSKRDWRQFDEHWSVFQGLEITKSTRAATGNELDAFFFTIDTRWTIGENTSGYLELEDNDVCYRFRQWAIIEQRAWVNRRWCDVQIVWWWEWRTDVFSSYHRSDSFASHLYGEDETVRSDVVRCLGGRRWLHGMSNGWMWKFTEWFRWSVHRRVRRTTPMATNRSFDETITWLCLQRSISCLVRFGHRLCLDQRNERTTDLDDRTGNRGEIRTGAITGD